MTSKEERQRCQVPLLDAAALSWMLNRKLTFDPVKEAFVNDDEANGLRSRPARLWNA